MQKLSNFTVELPAGVQTFKHTTNVHRPLEERIRRAMHYGGYKDFSAFALTAYASRCRQIEQEHGLDAEGRAVR